MYSIIMETEYIDEEEEVMTTTEDLNQMRDTIENMTKFNQVEILRILHDNQDVTLNENKYGTHINLSECKPDTVIQLKKYITYVATQEVALNQVEKQKETFKNIYFKKDNKDINKKYSKDEQIIS